MPPRDQERDLQRTPGVDQPGSRGHGPRSGSVPDRRPARLRTVGLTVVLAAAGLLFATSAETARGTQLRSDRADAAGLVRSEQERHAARLARNADLQARRQARIVQEARGDADVRALQRRAAALEPDAGLRAVTGPGLTVTLDDAPRSGRSRPDVKPDDLVVHQQDVQAVVNALWAGGAEAMQLMDQRVVSTSAVRCVGNTLILQGRVYSPPYRVVAVGDPTRLRAALAASPQVEVYQQYVAAVGLGWSVAATGSQTLPAYAGTLDLRHARVPATEGATGSSSGSSGPSTSSSDPSGPSLATPSATP